MGQRLLDALAIDTFILHDSLGMVFVGYWRRFLQAYMIPIGQGLRRH